MADLTTLENTKAWLGILTADDDPLLSRLISSASEFIQTWLNRTFEVQSYTEVRDGTGGCRMVFADYPVISVQGVMVDGRSIPSSTDFGTPGYRFDANRIMLTGYIFSRGLGNVQLAYTGGFAETPKEIEQACIELVSLRFKERDRIGHQSKSLAGETVSFVIKDMPDSVQTILNNYRKVVPL